MKRTLKHLQGNIVGYVALFVALSAGAYAAGLQPDSVKSKHIKDRQVTGADIDNDAVGEEEVTDASLDGRDLLGNTLGGREIVEETLAEVPRATIAGHGGYGRQSGGPENGTGCNPEDDLWVTCADVALSPSAPGRVLVTGRFKMAIEGNDAGEGECRLGSSAFGGIPGTTVSHFVSAPTANTEWITVTGVTDVFQPGNYSFGLDCRETGDGIDISQARVTAVVISPF